MNGQAMRADGFYKSELTTTQIVSRINRALKERGRSAKLQRPKAGQVPKGYGPCWVWVESRGEGTPWRRYCRDSDLPRLARDMGVETTVWLKVSGTKWQAPSPTTVG